MSVQDGALREVLAGALHPLLCPSDAIAAPWDNLAAGDLLWGDGYADEIRTEVYAGADTILDAIRAHRAADPANSAPRA